MQMLVLSSCSSGNCYIFTDSNNRKLILEAGVDEKLIMKGIDYDIANVEGCVISHSHNDHAKSTPALDRRGITILAPADVIERKQLTRHVHPVEPGRGYRLGQYRIMPFRVMHDVPCFGYIISHPEMGRTLFATDTYVLGQKLDDGSYQHYTFADITHWMLEANYTTWILDRNMKSGHITQTMKERLLTSHMSLGNCIKTLQRHDLTKTRDILLIHLSNGNSDERMFTKKVREATGKRTTIAKPYLTLDYSLGI